jgi:CRP-like cAMP-binding protein
VRTRIFFALERAGMRLALPAHAIFVTEENSDRAALKTEKQVQRRKQLLDAVGLFAPLSDAERDELVHHLRYAPFTRGEVLTRQGAEAHWLYLIEEGTVSVRVSEGGLERTVAQLGDRSFFGEMSLLTGEPRTATVVAETDVKCFRLEKAAFQSVLERRPELAEDLATILSRRRSELQAVLEGLDAESARQRQVSAKHDLLQRIRSFFGLAGTPSV